MKHITFLLSGLIFLASCSLNKNKTIYNERTKKDILIGECNREALTVTPFNEWFNPKYEAYKPDDSIIQKLKKSDKLNNIEILIVMGTWCGDSRRELPRFYKVIDELGFPDSKVTIVAVDTKKKSGNKILDDIEFTRIPTFIFYRDKKEIGRIVESTVKTLEEEISDIIQ